MRRALALAALAAPALVLAQGVPAPDGRVIEVDNFNPAITQFTTSYVNAAHCDGSAQMTLEWNIPLATTGSYRLFASNKVPDDTGFCPEQDDTAASPQVFAGPVLPEGSVVVEGPAQSSPVSGTAVATESGRACSSAGEGQEIWICAHWYDGNGTRAGAARGRFLVQVAAPAKPTDVSVGSGDGSLNVSWTASTGGTVDADRYVAEATPVAGGDTRSSDLTNATSTTISGLENGTEYVVRVFALSVGRNRSEPSDPKNGTPQPTDDFWEIYRATPGAREDGGCGTGGSGPLALLGVSLVALLRRRK